MKAIARNSTSIRLRNLAISLTIFVALVFYASTYSVPVLRISVIPGEPPSMLRRKIMPLTAYLENKIGMKIEFRPMADGDALVEALIGNKLDMVWIDGLNFIKAKSRSDGQVIPLVQRAADEQALSAFITPEYHDYSWTVRADMDVNLRLKLTDAFIALDKNNAQGKEILDLQHASRYIPARIGSHSAIEMAEHRESNGLHTGTLP